MVWSASERYGVAPAPKGLVLIQDFLNTRRRGQPTTPDLLGTVRQAQGWADEALREWCNDTARVYRRVKLKKADVIALVELRAGLAAALPGSNGADSRMVGALADATISAEIGGEGRVRLYPVGVGWQWITAALAIEMSQAQVTGTWRRLKTCRNPRCPAVFYDRSPNNSGAWHDVRTCGNVANLRASRARRRITTVRSQ
jgi:predicted RNA-binding Zn ribbon-like protein